jgi:hypothetical protein
VGVTRLAVVLALAVAACHPPASSTETSAVAAASVAVGAPAPDGPVATADGQAIHLRDRFAAGRTQTVLVFYRGFY